MSYADARQRLIDRGWQPVVSPPMMNLTTTPIVAYLLSQGYSELMGCQLVGVEICTFQFRNRKGHLLEIATVNLPILPRWYGYQLGTAEEVPLGDSCV